MGMLQTPDGISFSLKERQRIGGVRRNEKERETIKGQTGHNVKVAEKKEESERCKEDK